MGLSIYMKGCYEDFCVFGRRKNKPNSKPNLGKGKSKKAKGKMKAYPEFIRRSDLKKQTQFTNGRNGVMSYMKGSYGNIPHCGAQKNKAKQSQF